MTDKALQAVSQAVMTTAKQRIEQDKTVHLQDIEQYSFTDDGGLPVAVLPKKSLFKFSHTLVDEAYYSLMLATSYLSEAEQADILAAAHFGDKAHIQDRRKSGEPYITHPLAVAEILAGFRLDRDTLIAGILHDTVEDTPVTLDELQQVFGGDVPKLVDGVTKLKSSDHNKHQNKLATFYKIVDATLKDPRVLIIKLSDRLHNMSTLGAVKPEKQRATAQETLSFYIPLARVMGLNDIANAIELLCYRNLDNDMYGKLSDKLIQHGLGRHYKKNLIQENLQHVLHKQHIKGHVQVIDHQVSMFRQFFRNRGELNAILRQYAFEVVVDTIEHCHQLANFFIERYDIPNEQVADHIKHPPAGGNQSLTLTYRYDTDTIQVTILTKKMQQSARLGVMALENASKVSQSVIQASLSAMKDLVSSENAIGLLGSADEADSSEQAVNDFIHYLNGRKILIYSPQGQVYELPRSATALDFAYAVGPKIGDAAVSAVVNGQAVSLSTVLTGTQTVEIITDPQGMPKAEWLGFVVTTKARNLIGKWLRALPDVEKCQHGEQALERALSTYDKHLSDLSDDDWADLLEWQGVTDKQGLFLQISSGALLPQLVVTRLFSDHIAVTEQDNANLSHPRNLLANMSGVEINFAKCCNAIYGDEILGYNSVNQGLIVHRHKCFEILNTKKEQPNRVFPLSWRDKDSLKQVTQGERAQFTAYLGIQVLLDEEQISEGMILLKQLNIGVVRYVTFINHSVFYVVVRSRSHAQEGIDALRKLYNFISIKRLYAPNRFDDYQAKKTNTKKPNKRNPIKNPNKKTQ